MQVEYFTRYGLDIYLHFATKYYIKISDIGCFYFELYIIMYSFAMFITVEDNKKY